MLSLYVHDCDGTCQEIHVSPHDQIKRLDSNVKDGQKRNVVFDNHLIVGEFSFQFYGIKNGDHIYLLPNRQPKAISVGSAFLPERFNEAQKRFNMAQGFHPDSDHSLVLESVRLKDQYFNKIESNFYLNRAVMTRSFETERVPSHIKVSKKFADIKKLTSPSTTALPKFW